MADTSKNQSGPRPQKKRVRFAETLETYHRPSESRSQLPETRYTATANQATERPVNASMAATGLEVTGELATMFINGAMGGLASVGAQKVKNGAKSVAKIVKKGTLGQSGQAKKEAIDEGWYNGEEEISEGWEDLADEKENSKNGKASK